MARNASPSSSLIHVVDNYNSVLSWACVWCLGGFSPREIPGAAVLGTSWEHWHAFVKWKQEDMVRDRPKGWMTCLEPALKVLPGRSVSKRLHVEVRELNTLSLRTNHIQVSFKKPSWTSIHMHACPSLKNHCPGGSLGSLHILSFCDHL